MRTRALIAFAVIGLTACLSAADAPQGSTEEIARRAAEREKVIARCEPSEVVVLAKEERLGGKSVFTCTEILKAKDRRPGVGERFEFPVETAKRDDQPKEAVLFLDRFPPGG